MSGPRIVAEHRSETYDTTDGLGAHLHATPAVHVTLSWSPGDHAEALRVLDAAVASIREQVDQVVAH